MDVTVSTLAERPQLIGAMWEMPDAWPEFMLHDPVARVVYSRVPEEFPDYVHVATDEAGAVVARAFSVPVALGDGELPGRGWDHVLEAAFRGRRRGVAPDVVSALEIAIDPDRRGLGLSAVMVSALRAGTAAHGFAELVAPVRPNAKHREPDASMAEYAFRTREDGLPHDPWLRVHARAGAVIDRVAPVSMTIPGTLDEWREWTGLPFDAPGWVAVPGALAPVRCEPEHGYAVYVEPNVWVRHPVG